MSGLSGKDIREIAEQMDRDSRDSLKDEVFLAVARTVGSLGTCDRKQVGAVFVRDGRCISWGFNGAPPGMPHCSENNHGWEAIIGDQEFAGRWVIWPDGSREEFSCKNATHAEANALAFAARTGISVEATTLYVSVAPCDVCARLLIAAGISRVVAHEAYRDASGVELLKEAGIVVAVSNEA